MVGGNPGKGVVWSMENDCNHVHNLFSIIRMLPVSGDHRNWARDSNVYWKDYGMVKTWIAPIANCTSDQPTTQIRTARRVLMPKPSRTATITVNKLHAAKTS